MVKPCKPRQLVPTLIADGYLSGANQCPSPNVNARPKDDDISLLVIHNISLPPGKFGGGYVQQFFCNKLDPNQHSYFAEIAVMQVSSHLLIERTGCVTQFVDFNKRAWHAGQSIFAGRKDCNDYSIGIELEGTDNIAYTSQQYSALAEVSAALMLMYPSITPERITGHEHIAPERKTDPGAAFDWAYFAELTLSKSKALNLQINKELPA
jgi:AmpD protein